MWNFGWSDYEKLTIYVLSCSVQTFHDFVVIIYIEQLQSFYQIAHASIFFQSWSERTRTNRHTLFYNIYKWARSMNSTTCERDGRSIQWCRKHWYMLSFNLYSSVYIHETYTILYHICSFLLISETCYKYRFNRSNSQHSATSTIGKNLVTLTHILECVSVFVCVCVWPDGHLEFNVQKCDGHFAFWYFQSYRSTEQPLPSFSFTTYHFIISNRLAQ